MTGNEIRHPLRAALFVASSLLPFPQLLAGSCVSSLCESWEAAFMVFRVSNGVLEGGKAVSNAVSFLALLQVGEHAGAPSCAPWGTWGEQLGAGVP